MELNPKLAREVLEAHMNAGVPALMTGAPGIGKSDIVRQIAKARDLNVIDMRLSTKDPVDLSGVPYVKDGKTYFAPNGELPDEVRDGAGGILFLDELPQAAMAMQNAAFSLVLDRVIGAYTLPRGWHVIAAGNRVEDRAGANRMNSALANRFAHVELVHDVDAWCQWALGEGVAPELVAFIRFRPELLHSFEPDRTVNATPRSWSMAAKHVGKGLSSAVETAVLAGTVGEGPAAELVAFLRIWRNLPSPDAVFMNPTGADVPTDGATLYALCGALARKVTAQSMGAFVTYVSRLPAEYGVVAMRDATMRDGTLVKTPEAVAWFSANSEVYL